MNNNEFAITAINTSQAPAAIGPYNQAIRYGNFVYTSGQVALDAATGELVGNDVQAQTHRVFQNLQAVLESAGTSLKNVVKTTVFLATMNDFQAMNSIYAEYFTETKPARSTFAVAELPKKALVEIECVAVVIPNEG
jgi:2-iminobutanoate/2-iminopropanoate deaminase